jgi:hypothetical protein
MKGPLAALMIFASLPAGAAPEDPERAFHLSWRFYEWRVDQGDGLKELESILRRILKKYARGPVSLSMVERELEAVRELRRLAVQE